MQLKRNFPQQLWSTLKRIPIVLGLLCLFFALAPSLFPFEFWNLITLKTVQFSFGARNSNQELGVEQEQFLFTVLHTSDLHSHAMGRGPENYSSNRGGYERLLYLIRTLQNLNKESTLTLDGGDWFAGTLFHPISASYLFSKIKNENFKMPLELEFFEAARYDATALGNHEFDGDEEGLSHLLKEASNSNISIPILASNVHYDSLECKGLSNFIYNSSTPKYEPTRAADPTYNSNFRTFRNGKYIQPYLLKELRRGNQTLRVGIIGLYGPDAAMTSVAARFCSHFVGFDDSTSQEKFLEYTDFVYRLSTTLRTMHHADVIIALSHSGAPEDSKLIEALRAKTSKGKPVIDIHLSSHTHFQYTRLNPFDGTIFSQAGSHGVNLGVLQCSYDFTTKRVILRNYRTPKTKYFYIDKLKKKPNTLLATRLPVNSNIPKDEHFSKKLERYMNMINIGLLSNSPFQYSSKVGTIPTGFTSKDELASWLLDGVKQELCLKMRLDKNGPGYTIANKFVDSTESCEDIDVFVSSRDGIRVHPRTLTKANTTEVKVTFADVFKIFGIGTLKPGINQFNAPGDPLVTFYLKVKQIKYLIEAGGLMAYFNPVMTLSYSSSLSYSINPWGIPFVNRIKELKIHGKLAKDDQLILLSCPMWLAKFFTKIPQFTFGIFEFEIFDRFGRPLKHSIWHQATFYYDYFLFAEYLMKRSKREESETHMDDTDRNITLIQCSGIVFLEKTRIGNNITLVLSSMSTICFSLATLYLIVNLIRICLHRCNLVSNSKFAFIRRLGKFFNSSRNSSEGLLQTPQRLYSPNQLYLKSPSNTSDLDDSTPKVSGSEVSLFLQTQTLFYILMICFCILRGSYYAFEMALDIMNLPDEFSLLTIGISATANAGYHWASTFFYSAFFVLAINWSETYLYSYGYGPAYAAQMLRSVKIAFLVVNVICHFFQIILCIVNISIAMALAYNADAYVLGLKIVEVIQTSFHAVSSISTILLFIAFSIYSTSKVKKTSNYVRRASSNRMKLLLVIVCILCSLLLVKVLGNVALSILHIFFIICDNTGVLISFLIGLFADLAPLFLVTMILSQQVNLVVTDFGIVHANKTVYQVPSQNTTSSREVLQQRGGADHSYSGTDITESYMYNNKKTGENQSVVGSDDEDLEEELYQQRVVTNIH